MTPARSARPRTALARKSPPVDPADRIFRALSDVTRRRIVERLSRSPATVSELAEPFDMALPSFVQHLRVLEASELVRSTKAGRVRTYELVPRRLHLVEHWLDEQRIRWEHRFDRMDAYLLTLKEKHV
jgi:DNA-binding transcriptional ArsR family regulator